MRKTLTGALLVVLLAIGMPTLAAAQMREFKGTVDKVDQDELVVDSSTGDKLRFLPTEGVVVEGEKGSWQSLAQGDWVIVSWKMLDSPRVAYKVTVIPPQEDGAE